MAQSVSIPEVSKEQAPERARTGSEASGRRLSVGQRIATHVVLIVLSLVFLLPFFWMLSGSLKTDPELLALPIW